MMDKMCPLSVQVSYITQLISLLYSSSTVQRTYAFAVGLPLMAPGPALDDKCTKAVWVSQITIFISQFAYEDRDWKKWMEYNR